MRAVPCAVTCERHWAGKQSGLCRHFTPTGPARGRRRRGKEERSGRGGARPGRWGAGLSRRPGPGQRALQPQAAAGGRRPVSRQRTGEGAGAQAGGCRSPAGAAFHQDTVQGVQVAPSQALGQKPRVSAWTPGGVRSLLSPHPHLRPGRTHAGETLGHVGQGGRRRAGERAPREAGGGSRVAVPIACSPPQRTGPAHHPERQLLAPELTRDW